MQSGFCLAHLQSTQTEAENTGVETGGRISGAAIASKLVDIPKGSRILTFAYDTGERYLSVDGLFEG